MKSVAGLVNAHDHVVKVAHPACMVGTASMKQQQQQQAQHHCLALVTAFFFLFFIVDKAPVICMELALKFLCRKFI